MPTTLRSLHTPALLSANTAARRAEAQWRLDHWHMNPRNTARLQAFVGQPVIPATPKTVKSPAKVVAEAKADTLKAQASKAFDLVHGAAPEGSKMRLARKAYGQIIRGEVTLAGVERAIAKASK